MKITKNLSLDDKIVREAEQYCKKERRTFSSLVEIGLMRVMEPGDAIKGFTLANIMHRAMLEKKQADIPAYRDYIIQSFEDVLVGLNYPMPSKPESIQEIITKAMVDMDPEQAANYRALLNSLIDEEIAVLESKKIAHDSAEIAPDDTKSDTESAKSALNDTESAVNDTRSADKSISQPVSRSNIPDRPRSVSKPASRVDEDDNGIS